jgi:hypothetical protein
LRQTRCRSRQAARRRHNHRIRRERFIEYPQHAALGQRGVGYLAKFPVHRLAIEGIIDFRDKSLFLPDGLIDALSLLQLAALTLSICAPQRACQPSSASALSSDVRASRASASSGCRRASRRRSC